MPVWSWKTIIMFAITYGAYGLLLGDFLSWPVMWLLCIVMGMGLAGSQAFQWLTIVFMAPILPNGASQLLLGLTMNLIGGNAMSGRSLTNVVHHTTRIFTSTMRTLEIAPFIEAFQA
jgi:hypothetical protein